jgi:hypothetical protein
VDNLDQYAPPKRLRIRRRQAFGSSLIRIRSIVLFLAVTDVSGGDLDVFGLESHSIPLSLDFAIIGLALWLFFRIGPRVGRRFAERAARQAIMSR